VINEQGERVSVLLDVEDYDRILEELEELESIRACDAAKVCGREVISFEQAVQEIDRERESAPGLRSHSPFGTSMICGVANIDDSH